MKSQLVPPLWHRKDIFLAILTGFVVFITTAEATLIATEDFESSLGTLSGQTGGTGWAGPWSASSTGISSTVLASNLSYRNGEVYTPGGSQALQIQMANNANQVFANRQFSAQTDTLYMSFLYQKVSNTSAPNPDFLQFGLNNAAANPNGSVLETNGIFAARSGITGAASTGVSVYPAGTTHFVVLKIENTAGGANYDTMTAIINPNSLTEASNTLQASAVSPDALDLSSSAFLVLRRAFHESGDSYLVDSFRIGTSFSDVVTPVPEPTTMLGLLGIFSGLFFRRKRRLLN